MHTTRYQSVAEISKEAYDCRILRKVLRSEPEDSQHFKFLTEEDDDFVCLIEDSAFIWRNHLRKLLPNPIECRRDFLAKSLALGTKNGLRNEGGRQLAAAFALYFADRVEQRVRQLDTEKNHGQWN